MPELKASQRSRAIVLVVLLVVLVGVLAFTWRPAASPTPGPSNQPREQQKTAATTGAPSGSLDVRLDDLKQPPPAPSGENRNPFRFYVKPPPPPPTPPPSSVTPRSVGPEQPAVPPGPPPIPLKFSGTAEQGNKKVAIFVFNDAKGLPMYAAEGQLVAGQYRVVRIGVESVVMEYPNGTGRQTLPMRGGQ